MPSIQKIVITLAFAASVLGQGSQIADGQVQAVTATPVAQITDGQVQAVTSAPAVKQITDGQVQVAPTVTPVTPVKQITDGQIQVVPTVTPVKQITDGQIQAAGTAASTGVVPVPSNGTIASATPTAFTGAANIIGWSQEAVIAAIAAAAGFAML